MNRIFIITILLCANLFVKAQDEMVFSHYIMNPVLINPAATGFNGNHNLFLHYKNQWTGFTNAPRTIAASYNGAIGEKLGIGGYLSSDNAAGMSNFRGLLSYAFRFKINDFKGALGLSTEFKRMSFGNDVFINPLYQSGDNVVETAYDNGSFFDATMGAYGTYMDKLTFSFAMPNMIQTRLSQIAGGTTSRGGLRFINASMGFIHNTPNITVNPSILIQKMLDAPLRVDLNLKASFLEEKVIGALSYRAGTGGGLGVMVGTKLNGLTFAYSYDYGLQRFQNYAGGAHEVSIGYTIGRARKSSSGKIDNGSSNSFIDRSYNN
jgi:type IX secretion system PorP/SprF family membrane protein